MTRGEAGKTGPEGRPAAVRTITDTARQHLGWRTLAQGAIALLVFAAFWQVFLRGEIIAPTDMLLEYRPWSALKEDGYRPENTLRSDIVDSYLPSLHEFQDGLRDWEFTLWNPLRAQGRPLGATLESTVLHPLVFISLALLPLAEAFSVIVMGKLLAAGTFMYLFLRRWELGRPACALGAIAFAFSGFNIVWLMWPQTLVSAFAPMLFYAIEGIVCQPTGRRTALLALAVAIMIFGGFPAVTAYFFIAAALYFAVRVAHLHWGERDWEHTLRRCIPFGAAFGLGIGLTTVQLLPTREYANFADLGYRERFGDTHLDLDQLVQLAFPNYHGNQVFGNFDADHNLNESSGYVGTVTLWLALFGAAVGVYRRHVASIFFAALASGCVLVIYDIGPFLEVLSRFPIFSTNPSTRLLSVFGFATAVLGAFALNEILTMHLKVRQRDIAAALAALTAIVLLGVLAYLSYELIDRWGRIEDFRDDFPVVEKDTFRIGTTAFALGLTVAFLIAAVAHLRWRLHPRLLAGVALTVVAIDLLAFAYRQNPTINEELFYPTPSSIDFLVENQQPGERMAPFDATFMIPGTQMAYGLNTSFAHGLHDERQRLLIESFSENAFKTSTAVIPEAAKTEFQSPVVDLLGLRRLTFVPGTGPTAAQNYELVFSEEQQLDIYEYAGFEPAFVVSDVTVMSEEEALSAVISDAFRPSETAVVEEQPPGWFETGTAAGATVTLVKYDNETLEFKVTSPAPVLLVTHELYYPGWKATVDGEGRDIYRADYVLRGVFVEEGTHTVRFEYNPSSFWIGLVLTLLSAAGIVLLLFAPGLRRAFRRSRLEV